MLAALADYKLPALRQDAVRLAGDVEIVLFSRSGFTNGLIERARADTQLTLVNLDELVAGLDDPATV